MVLWNKFGLKWEPFKLFNLFNLIYDLPFFYDLDSIVHILILD